mmetsp:Transcript_32612/g.49872  ORF Transcript_32612/g.49872 Transcript_32612/m.49872 type:complete len:167 (-) Transcript_32612:761-1261(-)
MRVKEFFEGRGTSRVETDLELFGTKGNGEFDHVLYREGEDFDEGEGVHSKSVPASVPFKAIGKEGAEIIQMMTRDQDQFFMSLQGISNVCLALEFLCLNSQNLVTIHQLTQIQTVIGRLLKIVQEQVYRLEHSGTHLGVNADKTKLMVICCDILRFICTLFRYKGI